MMESRLVKAYLNLLSILGSIFSFLDLGLPLDLLSLLQHSPVILIITRLIKMTRVSLLKQVLALTWFID